MGMAEEDPDVKEGAESSDCTFIFPSVAFQQLRLQSHQACRNKYLIYRYIDPRPPRRRRRPGTLPLRPPRTTLRPRSPRLAHLVPYQPARARLRPPAGSIPARRRDRLRAAVSRLPDPVPPAGRGVRDAEARTGDGLRGQDGRGIRRE